MSGSLFSKRILPLADKEESLEEITKKLRDTGCQEEKAKKIIRTGARCLGESEKRPLHWIFTDIFKTGF